LEKDRNVIPLDLEQADKGIWRRKVILRSDLARKQPHKWVEAGGGGALEGVLMRSDQSGKTWL
jgi:hypothetical protein